MVFTCREQQRYCRRRVRMCFVRQFTNKKICIVMFSIVRIIINHVERDRFASFPVKCASQLTHVFLCCLLIEFQYQQLRCKERPKILSNVMSDVSTIFHIYTTFLFLNLNMSYISKLISVFCCQFSQLCNSYTMQLQRINI